MLRQVSVGSPFPCLLSKCLLIAVLPALSGEGLQLLQAEDVTLAELRGVQKSLLQCCCPMVTSCMCCCLCGSSEQKPRTGDGQSALGAGRQHNRLGLGVQFLIARAARTSPNS